MARTRSTENAKRFRSLFHLVGNMGREAAIKRLVSKNFVMHAEGPPSRGGRDALRAFFAQMRRGLPDLHITVDAIVAQGDMVAARSTWRGTHRGELMGIPPTGRAISFERMDFMRFEGNRAMEHWATFDNAAISLQLGFPPPRNMSVRRPSKERMAARARRLAPVRSVGSPRPRTRLLAP